MEFVILVGGVFWEYWDDEACVFGVGDNRRSLRVIGLRATGGEGERGRGGICLGKTWLSDVRVESL